MERYNKYLVLKNDDISKYMSTADKVRLDMICDRIRQKRAEEGKGDQQYVVVAADWPMYEDTWKSIEAFVDGKPSELEQLRTELDNKQARIDALMLEYCPDEMTPEQIENWEKYQQKVEG